MTLETWLSDVPWGPLVAMVVLAGLALVMAARGKRKRRVLAEVLTSGAKVIDVRSKAEYAAGHYAGAVNIPVDILESKVKTLGPKDGPLVVYCASGARSAQAAALLARAGFTAVTNAGGLGNMPRG